MVTGGGRDVVVGVSVVEDVSGAVLSKKNPPILKSKRTIPPTITIFLVEDVFFFVLCGFSGAFGGAVGTVAGGTAMAAGIGSGVLGWGSATAVGGAIAATGGKMGAVAGGAAFLVLGPLGAVAVGVGGAFGGAALGRHLVKKWRFRGISDAKDKVYNAVSLCARQLSRSLIARCNALTRKRNKLKYNPLLFLFPTPEFLSKRALSRRYNIDIENLDV